MYDDVEDIGEPVLLLSLDGGGIRGISEAVILHEIMKRVQVATGAKVLPKPCDYFHLIGGTSTGGLMAIMLGRLRMNTEEVIQEYEQLAERVFHKRNRRWDFSFGERALEECIKETVLARNCGNQLLDLENKVDKGMSFVVAMHRGGNENMPALFRSYVSHGERKDCEIWEAARATTAAPMIFKSASVQYGDKVESFIDGAVKWNNPSKIVLSEAKSHFGEERPLGCLISLGTGLRPPALTPTPKKSRFVSYDIGELTRITSSYLTNPEEAHIDLESQLKDCRDAYFRFSLPCMQELGRIRIHEYKKMPALKAATEEYLKIPYVSIAIDQVVDVLVGKNRQNISLRAACHTVGAPDVMQTVDKPGERSASPIFTGREDILQQMDSFFFPREATSSPRRDFWLWGIGGVGKTQIALRFMNQSRDRFDRKLWIDASNRTTILHSLRKIAEILLIGHADEASASSVISWMETTSENWLLVIDNYDDGDISPYLPNSSRGNVIFTSRQSNLPPDGVCKAEVEVSKLDIENAVKLLTRSAKLSLDAPNVLADAEELANELGSLPLALDQAGSYIGNRGCSISEYIASLLTQKQELMSDELYCGALLDNKGVYASFDLTFNHFINAARQDSAKAPVYRSAIQLLNTFCFYHHDSLLFEFIPLALHNLHDRDRFDEITPALYTSYGLAPQHPPKDTTSPTDASSMSFLGMREDGTFSAEFLLHGAELLAQFALIKREPEWIQPRFSMHGLVHSWARDRMKPQAFKVYHGAARNVLFGSIYTPNTTWHERIYPHLIPHMRAVRTYNAAYQDDVPFARKTEMDRKFTAALNKSGHWEESVDLLNTILEERIYELGSSDPSTLEVMLQLAKQYRVLARWGDSYIMLIQLSERLDLCPDPFCAREIHYQLCLELAVIYLYHAMFSVAEELVQMVIRLVEHGKGQLTFLLSAKQKLSLIYQYQLKWEDAEKVSEELYATRKKRGPGAFITLRVYRELCFIRIQRGRAAAMENQLKQIAEKFEALYGAAHLEVLVTKSDLGWAYFKQGKFEEAETVLAKVLSLARASLGNQNNFTLTVAFRLGLTLSKLGKLQEGASLVQEAYRGRVKALDVHHPATVGTGAWMLQIFQELRAQELAGKGKVPAEAGREGDGKMGSESSREVGSNIRESNNQGLTFDRACMPFAELPFSYTR